ncbi:MAG TPA: hypothetical protein VNJ51_05970 [Candidatus Dormibacteraeota bacterium]|nr:hypothetical protein [Candidatus Dormibacteraeota bacterium]
MVERTAAMWRELGVIIQLQIELDRLKDGDASRYRVELIRHVEGLHVSPDGAVARVGEGYVLDVHHAAHPATRSNATNHLSIGFTGHYDAMRERFGEHIALGAAGESLIVERPGRTQLADLGEELLIELPGEPPLRIERPAVMRPCAPFSRFCLDEGEPPPERLKATLQFLDGGIRGFKGMPAGNGVVIAGARLHARTA